jgi:hypothetical protein
VKFRAVFQNFNISILYHTSLHYTIFLTIVSFFFTFERGTDESSISIEKFSDFQVKIKHDKSY